MGTLPFRILVADDHPIVRRGIVDLIGDAEDLSVCGEAMNSEQTAQKVERLNPDLLVLDLFLGDVIALDLIKKLRQERPSLLVLVITMQAESLFAERALRAGAHGYILKDEATKEILNAIRLLLAGKQYISGRVYVRMLHRMTKREAPQEREFFNKLSDRELQVFRLLGAGGTTRGIARDLTLSIKSVETLCARIKKKLHLQNSHQLIRYAARWHSEL